MNYLQRKKQFFQFADLPQIIKKGKLKTDYDGKRTNYYLRGLYGDFIYSWNMTVYGIIIPENAKKLIVDNGNKKFASNNIHAYGVGINFESNAIVLGTSATNYIEIEIKEDYIGKMFLISVVEFGGDISNCIFEITG